MPQKHERGKDRQILPAFVWSLDLTGPWGPREREQPEQPQPERRGQRERRQPDRPEQREQQPGQQPEPARERQLREPG